MQTTIYYDSETGQIRSAAVFGDGGSVTVLDSPLARLVIPGEVRNFEDVYVKDNTLYLRPSIPELAVSNVLVLSTLPEGTTVLVANEAGDNLEITDLSEPLHLLEAGVYTISITPPFPYKPFSQVLELPNA